ncbi:MAG: hypothetical protein ABI614_14050 [Planctomycetota bacterium]
MSDQAKAVAENAKAIYGGKLCAELERDHFGEYVCIEPESGEYFLGKTFDDAVNEAIDAHPGRLTYTLRVGHGAALHLGVLVQ